MGRIKNEINDDIIIKAQHGNQEAINCIIKNYEYIILKLVSSFDIKAEDQNDFIQEGYCAILKAIESYSFKSLNFNNYVKRMIEKSLSHFLLKYYKNNHSKMINNKLDGENIYNSDDSLIDMDTSLNSTMICDGEIMPYGESIASLARPVEEEAIKNNLKKEVEEFFKRTDLTQLEKEIIQCRYGFYGSNYTLKQIAQELGITPQCVSQKEQSALYKLRKLKAVKQFAEYMTNPKKALEYVKQFQQFVPSNDKPKAWVQQVKFSNLFDLLDINSNEEKQLYYKIIYYLPRREKVFLATIFRSYYLTRVNMDNIPEKDLMHIEKIVELMKEINEEITSSNLDWQEYKRVVRFYVRTRFSKRLFNDYDNLAYYFDYAYSERQLTEAIKELKPKYSKILYNKCYNKDVKDSLYFNYSDNKRLEDAIYCLKVKLVELYPNVYCPAINDILVALLRLNDDIKGITAIDLINKNLFFETYGKPLSFEEVLAISSVVKGGKEELIPGEVAKLLGITVEELDDVVAEAMKKSGYNDFEQNGEDETLGNIKKIL